MTMEYMKQIAQKLEALTAERDALAERQRDAKIVPAGRDVKIAHQPSASPRCSVSAARRPPVRAELLPVTPLHRLVRRLSV